VLLRSHKSKGHGAVAEETSMDSPLHGDLQAEPAPAKRSAANRSVLAASCVLWAMECTVAAGLMPFFPRVAAKARGGSALAVGCVFAVFPLATAVASPAVPALSKLLRSRCRAIYLGLVLAIVGLAGFARSSTVPAWIGWRSLQGAACALVDVPAMGLLLTHSRDVAEDTGVLEAVAGGSYMVAPFLGGLLYESCGFANVFFVLAAAHAAVLLVAPRLLADAAAADAADAAGAPAAPGGPTPPSGRAAVGWAAACFGLSNASLSFYDAALAPHARATLGFGALETGLVYLVPSAIYASISPFAGGVVRRFGARDPLVAGCAAWALASLVWGPVPLAAAARAPGAAARAYDYACLGAWSLGCGVAVALVYQCPLPLAKRALGGGRPLGAAADDALAAVFQAAGAAGQVAGPLLGGWLVDAGRQWAEPGCDLARRSKCRSGFFSASATFAGLFALLAPCLLAFVASDRPAARATSLEEPLLVDAAFSPESSTSTATDGGGDNRVSL